MPQNPEEFAKKLPEWSRWKHAILEGYLKPFTGKLQDFNTVYFIDGFAGAGRYDDDSKGSALRTAELAKLIADTRWYSLHCINVENDADVFKRLEASTQPYNHYVTNYQGTFGGHIPKILGVIAEQPALFFIDPFGFKGIEWDTLLPIFKRKPTKFAFTITEVIIRFDAPFVSRYAGSMGKANIQAQNNTETLLKLFGLKDENSWDALVAKTGTDYEGLAEAYQERLREHFRYVVRMPIRAEDEKLKYYLIFATRHEGAITAMNDVLYKVEDMRAKVIQKQNISPETLMLPGLEEFDILDELETLKQIVLQVLPVGKRIKRSELITQVATTNNYFGAFSQSHFTAILGGKPRNISVPKQFISIEKQIELNGTPSNDKTEIHRIK